MHKLHEPVIKEKIATNYYVKENAWLNLTSSWSIKDLERNYNTFPETHSGSLYDLHVWVIMETAAEDPGTKANAFRVPQYDSWQKMLDLGTFTIKDMVKAMVCEEEPTPPKITKAKKGRSRKGCHAKSKAVVESDSSNSADDNAAKSGGKRVKTL